jgi:hypothetical protein
MTGTNFNAAPNNKTVRKFPVKYIYILFGTINKTEFPVSAAKPSLVSEFSEEICSHYWVTCLDYFKLRVTT